MNLSDTIEALTPNDGAELKKLCGKGLMQGAMDLENGNLDDVWAAATIYVAKKKAGEDVPKWSEFKDTPWQQINASTDDEEAENLDS